MNVEKRILWDKKTGKDFVPVSHTEAVVTPDGETSETRNTRQMQAVKGVGDDADAGQFPFMSLGEVSDITDMNNLLDEAYNKRDAKYQGRLRIKRNGQTLWVDQTAIDYSHGYWMQVTYGPYAPAANGARLMYDSENYHICWRMKTLGQNKTWRDLTQPTALKTINGQSIIGYGNIVINTAQQITIDTDLNGASGNAIANSAVTSAVGNLQTQVTDAEDKAGVHIMPIEGLLSSSVTYEPEQQSYDGNEGVIYYDVSNNRPVLYLAGETSASDKYYTSWSGNQNRSSSQAYTAGNRMFFFVGQDGIHIGKVSGGQWVEIKDSAGSSLTIDTEFSSTSSNPVANSTIKSAIDDINGTVGNLSGQVSNITGTFLPLHGFLSVDPSYIITPRPTPYTGEGGEVLYEADNHRLLLRVRNEGSVSYYDTWYANGSRLASTAYISNNQIREDILLWIVSDSQLHVYKSANGTLIDIIASGGSSVTIDTTLNDTSTNPVENRAIQLALSQKQDAIPNISQRLENSEDNITALFQMLKALDDKVKSYHEEDEPIPGIDDDEPFDPSVGNVGSVFIYDDPEDITTQDVIDALTLTPLADDLPSGMKIYNVAAEGSEGASTADVVFKPGNTSAAKTYNTNLLIQLCKATGDYADCAGLHLDQVYYIKRDAWVSSLAAAMVDNGIPLEKDFTIDGEVNGVATGGFSTTSHFFYTRHSLNLNKAIFETTNNQGYYAFCIDAVLGIDQVIVTGCKFLTSNQAGKHFTFVARDQSPLDQDGILAENNCVGDVLFQDNEFDGANVIYQGWSKRSSYFRTYTEDEEDGQGNTIPALQNNVGNVLFKNSFRFIGNNVGNVTTPMVGMGVSLSTANENAGDYDSLKAYTSCPLWMAGNTFQGKKGLTRASSSTYYTALLAEFSRIYFLHNNVSDLIAAQNVYDYTNAQGVTKRTTASHYVYDLYASVTQLFCCNNTFYNLAKLTNDHTYFGIVKGKGVCVPGRYTAEHMPVERLYFGNVYTVNQQEITAYWNQRTYPQSGGSYNYTPMVDYDNTVDINNVLSIKFTSGAWSIPVKNFLFKQNTVNAPLLETISYDGYGAEHFIFEDNEFNTLAVKDDVYDYLFSPESCKEILFRHNTFTAIPSSRKFFFIEYQQSAGRPTITFADSNAFPQGVTHVIARFFCRTTGQYENVEVSINGEYDPYATDVEASTATVI